MEIITDLKIFWYIVFIASVIFYSILDGFDLGVGILNVFNKEDIERRVCLNAIGPVWDGNEVWLIIMVGGLFAGFPGAYATLLSSFYIPTTILIAGLIFRAVAIEFRSKKEGMVWRWMWDICFFAGSLVIALGMGIVLGNLIAGIPLDNEFEFIGQWGDLFQPYAWLVGLTAVACFTMHGAIYLVMKTEGKLHDRMRRRSVPIIWGFVVLYLLTTYFTLTLFPHMTQRMMQKPWLFVFALLAFLCILNIPRQMNKRNDGWAFISSAGSITVLLLLYAIGIFPCLVCSSVNPAQNSVTVYNAGASETTLIILAIIVAIGLPLVFAYGTLVYRVFRGKVKMDKMSY